MPFEVATNTSHLEIRWSYESNAQTIDFLQLKNQYSFICIQGTNNEYFENYDIISRTQALDISKCTIDVAKIDGNMGIISLNNCICKNNFTTDCRTFRLDIIDSQIKIQQLLNLKIEILTVQVSSHLQLDYYNCCNLNCGLNCLTLININIDLQQLNGTWNTIKLDNCIFSGQIDNSKLKVSTLELVVTEQHYANNFEYIDKLQCFQFYLANNKTITQQSINLASLQNSNKQKQLLYAYLENTICDLSAISDIWTSIRFTNCTIQCDAHSSCAKFSNTNIEITQNEHHNQNYLLDFKIFQQFKPKELTLKQLSINLEELEGSWNSLSLQQCSFINNKTNGTVRAAKILISHSNQDVYSYFSSDTIIISQCQVNSYPNATKLEIHSSTINITQPNHTIQSLFLFNVKLQRFSILDLRALQSIDLNSIQKSSPLYRTREAIINFLRYKKKNRNIVKQRLQRVEYERKLKLPKEILNKQLVYGFNLQLRRVQLIFYILNE
ncbi:Hypothetical_protein [Hexamita inflata]|uniref:Hypothetical_protein n=1 Tax=Hexamita inflata TaxID=28002 RepID=A0AA86TY25_9EUKA|nr:Hypothetical protein HINF_LOCUS18977 [Hexamita inflata]CAI9967297.1 Hypothetical protein HINF_LOCUS54942 [Hexamita inflata]